ncbi:hypothetical protein N7G274_004180 [Stereocaulon virgatum]|uniref:Uncharacterized protein n=1 Tax=Stereocaulon virgatum TaxID=373712 RepID=A0ABR4AC87_9LECA
MPEQALKDASNGDTASIRSRASSVSSSSFSTSAQSETSTIRYPQEPWNDFKLRVEKSSYSLWLSQTSIEERVLEALRTNKFFASFVPPPQTPLIDRLRGAHPSKFEMDEGRADRDVATLIYVRQRTSIPVLEIIAKDFSCANPLEKPYVIQNCTPGSELNTIWATLSHSRQCKITCETGRTIMTLLSLESPVVGLIEAIPPNNDPDQCLVIVRFELKESDGEVIEEPAAQDFKEDLARDNGRIFQNPIRKMAGIASYKAG